MITVIVIHQQNLQLHRVVVLVVVLLMALGEAVVHLVVLEHRQDLLFVKISLEQPYQIHIVEHL